MTARKHHEPLNVDFLIMAYCNGYFPMADPRTGAVSWYSPDPRAIIPLDGFKISRSLARKVRSNVFEIKRDTAFTQVMQSCAEREETWISRDMIRAYTDLHDRGLAHSVESWRQGMLVGGLYGVSMGGAFFGESMFSRESDASKVALVHLVVHLRARNFLLLDTQFANEHIRQFGVREIPRAAYLSLLADALQAGTDFSLL
jgi:leucyl/phenylalanyl-tRNA--protein transferase